MADPPKLGELIDQEIDSGHVHPRQVAEAVLAKVPREVLEQALPVLLTYAVRARQSQRRASNPIINGAAAMPRYPSMLISSERLANTLRDAEEYQKLRIQQLLHDPVYTGSGYQALGKMTAAELERAAEHLRSVAERNLVRAGAYHTIAEAVVDHGVNTVEELPEEVLLKLAERG